MAATIRVAPPGNGSDTQRLKSIAQRSNIVTASEKSSNYSVIRRSVPDHTIVYSHGVEIDQRCSKKRLCLDDEWNCRWNYGNVTNLHTFLGNNFPRKQKESRRRRSGDSSSPHTHTHTIYIYIYVCIFGERKREEGC
jgi:hypothetical protein